MFRTEDPDRHALAAVKAYVLDLTPDRTQHLADELQRLAELKIGHPHIAQPIAAGVEGSAAYLAQQYVDAESLDTAIRQYGPAPAADAARLVAHIADALDEAAKRDVFHGSLHPRDVLVTPGDTHMTGLGVAQALERIGMRAPVRRPYAAPERDSSGLWGAAADIYSLAAIAYEIITGRRAMPGTDDPLPGLAGVAAANPAALREALESAFDPDPSRRPATARELVTSIAIGLLGDTPLGAASGDPRGSSRTPRRAPVKEPRLPGLEDPLAAKPAERPSPQPPTPIEPLPPPIATAPPPIVTAPPMEAAVAAGMPDAPEVELEVPEPEPPDQEADLDLSAVLPAAVPAQEDVQEFDFSALDRTPQPLRSASGAARPARPRLELPGPDAPPVEPHVPQPPAPSDPGGTFLRRPESTGGSGGMRLPIVGSALAAGFLIGVFAGYLLFGHREPPPSAAAPPSAVAARPTAPGQSPTTVAAASPVGAERRTVPAPPAVSPPAAAPASPGPARNAVGGRPPVNPPARRIEAARPAAPPAPRPAAPVLSEEIATSGDRRLRATPPARGAVPKPPAATAAAKPQAPKAAAQAKPGEKLVDAASMHFETRPPGARVILDGRDIGRTPTDVPAISVGRHAVRFELDGYVTWSTTVTTSSGKQTRVTASMNRGPGK